MARPKRGEEHPRPELKERVKELTAVGVPHATIAALLKMGLDTLHRHYRYELDHGMMEANAAVGGQIFRAAMRGESWACTFWAARRMGWKESHSVQLDGVMEIVSKEQRDAAVRAASAANN